MKRVKNILIAPDKFKFTLSAFKVAEAISKGFVGNENINLFKIPLADGGEGTSAILSDFFNAEEVFVKLNNPLFKIIEASYFFSEENKLAIIDFASASGLQLLKKEEQNPMFTSSYGTGEIILDAIKKGAKKIILGLGGSATTDCGIGAANAFGFRFLDINKKDLSPIGKNMIHIAEIDDSNVDTSLNDVEFIALYDVKNVLFGKKGAANIYAKQKGANNDEIKLLDDGLRNISKIVRKNLNKDISNIVGGGAAGGFGAGAFAFLSANLIQGSDYIFDTLNIDSFIQKSDLIITGEGKFDLQSLEGKLVGELIKKANYYKKPIVVVCGISELKKEDLNYKYLHSVLPLFEEGVDIEFAKQNTKQMLIKMILEVVY